LKSSNVNLEVARAWVQSSHGWKVGKRRSYNYFEGGYFSIGSLEFFIRTAISYTKHVYTKHILRLHK